jgi:hypothetical protein
MDCSPTFSSEYIEKTKHCYTMEHTPRRIVAQTLLVENSTTLFVLSSQKIKSVFGIVPWMTMGMSLIVVVGYIYHSLP